MEMKILAAFVGSNRDFRAWLKAGMPENIISLAEYKKTAPQEADTENITLTQV